MFLITSGRKGFSLLEIVIATALLGVVIVTICSVFAKGLEALKKGQKNARAIHIATRKLSEVTNIDLSDPSGIPCKELCDSITGYDSGTIDPNDTISWNLAASTVNITGTEEAADVTYDFNIEISSFAQNLKKISVTLTWYDAVIKENKTLELDTLLARKAYD